MIKLGDLLNEDNWTSSKDRWPDRNKKVVMKTDLGKEFTGHYNPSKGWVTDGGKKVIGVVKWKPAK